MPPTQSSKTPRLSQSTKTTQSSSSSSKSTLVPPHSRVPTVVAATTQPPKTTKQPKSKSKNKAKSNSNAAGAPTPSLPTSKNVTISGELEGQDPDPPLVESSEPNSHSSKRKREDSSSNINLNPDSEVAEQLKRISAEMERVTKKFHEKERVEFKNWLSTLATVIASLPTSSSSHEDIQKIKTAFKDLVRAHTESHQAQEVSDTSIDKLLNQKTASAILHLLEKGGNFDYEEVKSIFERVPIEKVPSHLLSSKSSESSEQSGSEYIIRIEGVPKDLLERIGQLHRSHKVWADFKIEALRLSGKDTLCLVYTGTAWDSEKRLETHLDGQKDYTFKEKVLKLALESEDVEIVAYQCKIPNGSVSAQDRDDNLEFQELEICLIAVLDGPFSLNVAGGGHCRNIRLDEKQRLILDGVDNLIKEFNKDPRNVKKLSEPPESPPLLRTDQKDSRWVCYQTLALMVDDDRFDVDSMIDMDILLRGLEYETSARNLSHGGLATKDVPENAAKDETGNRTYFG